MARESKNSYGNSVYTLVVHCVQKVLWDPYSSLSSFVLKKHSLYYRAKLIMKSHLQFWTLDTRISVFMGQIFKFYVCFWNCLVFKVFYIVETRVSKGRDVPLSLCPGTKIFPCPFVPGQVQEQKSRDKLLCPGMSQDKIIFPPKNKEQEKDILKQEKDVLKQEKMFSNRKLYHSIKWGMLVTETL